MALFRSKTAGQQISINVSGANALKKRLDAFSQKIKKKAVKTAFLAMAKPIVKAVSAVAPKSTGILSKNIKAKVIAKSKRTKQQTLRIGAQNKKFKVVRRMFAANIKATKSVQRKLAAGKIRGYEAWHNPSRVSHLVSEGTKRGVKATEYLRKGFNASKSAAVAAFIESMKTSVKTAAQEAKSA